MDATFNDIDREQNKIRQIKPWLVQNIRLEEILDDLYASFVINMEQNERLQATLRNDGNTHAVRMLVDLVLKSSVSLSGFMQVLKYKMGWIYDRIQNVAASSHYSETTNVWTQELRDLDSRMSRMEEVVHQKNIAPASSTIQQKYHQHVTSARLSGNLIGYKKGDPNEQKETIEESIKKLLIEGEDIQEEIKLLCQVIQSHDKTGTLEDADMPAAITPRHKDMGEKQKPKSEAELLFESYSKRMERLPLRQVCHIKHKLEELFYQAEMEMLDIQERHGRIAGQTL